MRFSDFERWMFRLGAAAAIITLAAMAVRDRIAAPPAVRASFEQVHSAGTTTSGTLLLLPAVTDQVSGAVAQIPHVYSGAPMSAAWANRLVDKVNSVDTRLEKIESATAESGTTLVYRRSELLSITPT